MSETTTRRAKTVDELTYLLQRNRETIRRLQREQEEAAVRQGKLLIQAVGVGMSITDLSSLLGIRRAGIYQRLYKAGWSQEGGADGR